MQCDINYRGNFPLSTVSAFGSAWRVRFVYFGRARTVFGAAFATHAQLLFTYRRSDTREIDFRTFQRKDTRRLRMRKHNLHETISLPRFYQLSSLHFPLAEILIKNFDGKLWLPRASRRALRSHYKRISLITPYTWLCMRAR